MWYGEESTRTLIHVVGNSKIPRRSIIKVPDDVDDDDDDDDDILSVNFDLPRYI